LRHLLDQRFERAELRLQALDLGEYALPRTGVAIIGELKEGERRPIIAPALVRWAVALLWRQDLGGGPQRWAAPATKTTSSTLSNGHCVLISCGGRIQANTPSAVSSS
jgi:hypothetical protein